ncbi:hypothetical protein KAW50_05830 [candidate division WOR-3 bacterium]|nr:hypothetical protein [candidate division WOR-3 bacterium]
MKKVWLVFAGLFVFSTNGHTWYWWVEKIDTLGDIGKHCSILNNRSLQEMSSLSSYFSLRN